MKRAILILILVGWPPGAFAQLSPELSGRLVSPDWTERRDAYSMIIAKDHISAEEETALISLLARENNIGEQAYREGAGSSGKYGEEYSEYAGWLADTVLKIAQRGPSRTDVWAPLLRVGYLPESPFGIWIASHGDRTASFLIGQAQGNDSLYTRGDALFVLSEMAAYERNPHNDRHLAPDELERIEAMVRAGAHDKDTAVRSQAARGLALMGNDADLAMLERMALTDEDVRTDGGPSGMAIRFPVREVARKAADRLRKRLTMEGQSK